MISKELLNAVYPNGEIENIFDHGPKILVEYANHQEVINVYELAYMCKKWAFSLGYRTMSGIWSADDDCKNYDEVNSFICILSDNTFEAPTENGAIFKACEFILKETK
ncbi:MAG: hypothetical protein KAI79_18020 [Bacteroidales bacterium]|nr:hypothetical protein [Bacteroidales bacterium]